MKKIIVNQNDSGKRIDAFLKKLMPEAPTSLIYKYIRTKKVKVNGKKPKEDLRLSEGDEILFFGDEKLIKVREFKSESYKIDVVFEDENILVINKPKGLACQPDIKRKSGTLVDYVKSYLFEKGEYKPNEENTFAPALCNRIDFNTEGLVIAAKNYQALREMTEKIKNKEVRKFYLCGVFGTPPRSEGVIRGQIEKDTVQNKSKVVKSGGVYAESHYKVLKVFDNKSILEVEIKTGRSHQIRTHLSSIGCPIIGDKKYGGGSGGGQNLVSYRLLFDFKNDDGVLGYLKGREFAIFVEFKNLL